MNSDLCTGTDDNYDDNDNDDDNDSNNDNDVPENTNPCFCLSDFFLSVRLGIYLYIAQYSKVHYSSNIIILFGEYSTA